MFFPSFWNLGPIDLINKKHGLTAEILPSLLLMLLHVGKVFPPLRLMGNEVQNIPTLTCLEDLEGSEFSIKPLMK